MEIHHSATSLSAPEKVRFEVKLEPQDGTWRGVGGNRSIYYHDLQPGDYLFRVRAANNDGVWNEVGSSVAFAIQPYLWQTRWFYVGAALLLVGLGAGASVWRHHSLHRRNLESIDRDRRHHSELAHFGRVAALGQMASSIAHELNQPLGAILRNSEAGQLLLGKQPLDVEELRAILSDIQADERRAGDVIARMRSFLKHGRVEGAEVDARSLCVDVAKLVEFEARTVQARLVVDLPTSLPKVFGDRVQLQQVVLNLLLNALDAVRSCRREHRVVTLAAWVSGRDLEITVSDCGPGLAPDSLPRVFEAFHTTKPNGLGMGLTIARSIAEAHGGTLSAANRNEGGAVFRFTVPWMAQTGSP